MRTSSWQDNEMFLMRSDLYVFFLNLVFNHYRNKKNSPNSGFDVRFFLRAASVFYQSFAYSAPGTSFFFDGESVSGVVCGIEKQYLTSRNKEMKGPSFVTALLCDEANRFVPLEIPLLLLSWRHICK